MCILDNNSKIKYQKRQFKTKMEDVSYTYLSETATLRQEQVKEKLNMNKKSGNEVSEIGTSIHRQNKQQTIRNKPTRIHIYV